jgi:hypothetical protein
MIPHLQDLRGTTEPRAAVINATARTSSEKYMRLSQASPLGKLAPNRSQPPTPIAITGKYDRWSPVTTPCETNA